MSKIIKLPGNEKLFNKWRAAVKRIVQLGHIVNDFGGIAQNEVEIELSDIKEFKKDFLITRDAFIDMSATLELLFDESIDYVKEATKKQ